MVRQLYALEEKVQTLGQQVQGRVSIASIYSVGLTHMNRCVRSFLREHSKADIHIEYHHPDRVYELVESGRVDIGLVSYPKQSRTMRATTWLREPIVVACAGEHALASHKRVTMAQLNGLEMVGFSEGLQIRQEIDRFLAQHAVEARIPIEFDNIETLKRAVEVNAGFSLLPLATFAREAHMGTLVAVPLADAELFRPVGILGAEVSSLAERRNVFLIFCASMRRRVVTTSSRQRSWRRRESVFPKRTDHSQVNGTAGLSCPETERRITRRAPVNLVARILQ